jgi:hypothetical protein
LPVPTECSASDFYQPLKIGPFDKSVPAGLQ